MHPRVTRRVVKQPTALAAVIFIALVLLETTDCAGVQTGLQITQCRTACLEKYTFMPAREPETLSQLDDTFSTGRLLMESYKASPNILRSKRVAQQGTDPYFSSLSCLHSLPECLSCWKHCQDMDTESTSDNAKTNAASNSQHVADKKLLQKNLSGQVVTHEQYAAERLALESKTFIDLQLVSTRLENSLVIAKILWNRLQETLHTGSPKYLVTWEGDGGWLTGYLVTNSTDAELSLSPNMTYNVQVRQYSSNLDSDGVETLVPLDKPEESLLVDTNVYQDENGTNDAQNTRRLVGFALAVATLSIYLMTRIIKNRSVNSNCNGNRVKGQQAASKGEQTSWTWTNITVI